MSIKTRHILSLDGGGARGLYTLHMLLHIKKYQKISDSFSLVVGVSVGAMIAALVALGIVDRPDVVSLVNENFADIFRARNELGPLLAPKYSGAGKRDVLRRVFGDATFRDVKIPLAILVCNTHGKTLVFDSFTETYKDIRIADIVDASSAAPSFFPPVFLHGYDYLFDGGAQYNCPSLQAFALALKNFDPKTERLRLLSIGTCGPKKVRITSDIAQDMGVLAWLSAGLMDVMMRHSDDTVHTHMQTLLGHKNALRIACPLDMPMDDFSTPTINALMSAASTSWSQHGSAILSFLGHHNM